MASWHYAFLFPGSNEPLKPECSIDLFVQSGFEFDDIVRSAVTIDADGHLEFVNEVRLKADGNKELKLRLKDGEQFLTECRNRELFFSISFATSYSNPFIMIGWSKKIFTALAQNSKDMYWLLLRKVARSCNANYIVIVDDPPDYFEDRFIDIDGKRLLDNKMSSGKCYEIRYVWIDSDVGALCPDGIRESSNILLEDGFTQYII